MSGSDDRCLDIMLKSRVCDNNLSSHSSGDSCYRPEFWMKHILVKMLYYCMKLAKNGKSQTRTQPSDSASQKGLKVDSASRLLEKEQGMIAGYFHSVPIACHVLWENQNLEICYENIFDFLTPFLTWQCPNCLTLHSFQVRVNDYKINAIMTKSISKQRAVPCISDDPSSWYNNHINGFT